MITSSWWSLKYSPIQAFFFKFTDVFHCELLHKSIMAEAYNTTISHKHHDHALSIPFAVSGAQGCRGKFHWLEGRILDASPPECTLLERMVHYGTLIPSYHFSMSSRSLTIFPLNKVTTLGTVGYLQLSRWKMAVEFSVFCDAHKEQNDL